MFCHGLLLTAAAALPLAPLSPWPSVSVQMVTYNRGPLLLEAIEQVGYQDYQGSLEVVIIDDSPKSMAEELDKAIVQSPRALALRYVYLEERMSIGAKRNLATRSTSAEVICIWDDDDVFTMDRIRKQVQHLQGGVNCSAIEVASFYSVPDQELSVRPIGLEPIAFENTLCFSRDWWESGNFGFGESWEVSGQGEGTLEPWWSQVDPLSGAEEPFLYIYLPSSASGGTALNKNRSPPPSAALAALSKALHPSSARFPEKHRGAHVSKALAAARSEVEALLGAPQLMEIASPHGCPVETLVRRSRPSAGRVNQLVAQYPESWEVATDRLEVAQRVWSRLETASLSDLGWLLVDRLTAPFRRSPGRLRPPRPRRGRRRRCGGRAAAACGGRAGGGGVVPGAAARGALRTAGPGLRTARGLDRGCLRSPAGAVRATRGLCPGLLIGAAGRRRRRDGLPGAGRHRDAQKGHRVVVAQRGLRRPAAAGT
ncbi:unnamed protein product, partial [Cladocopium goreaui]